MEDSLEEILSDSTEVLKRLINHDDPRHQLRAIETAVKLRKQLVDEEHFNIRLALETEKEAKIDFGDVEEVEQYAE